MALTMGRATKDRVWTDAPPLTAAQASAMSYLLWRWYYHKDGLKGW